MYWNEVHFFYNVLKRKKKSKFKKYFDQHCYIACFEMIFLGPVKSLPWIEMSPFDMPSLKTLMKVY